MARAGPSRSQKAPQQSQPRGGRRASHRGDQEEDEEEIQGDDEDDEDVDMDEGADTSQGNKGDELTRKANDLVRLALFTEHKRTPLRREDINKKGVSPWEEQGSNNINYYNKSWARVRVRSI
jgi:hypothetical protein